MRLKISKSQLQKRQRKLNDVLYKVSECVNKKVTDPKKLQSLKKMYKSTQPQNLKGGALKDYQKQALVWMIELAFKNMNGILADDMGMGKTIQSVAYLAYLKQENGIKGKHMIIAPLTTINNWKRQVNKWLPELNTQILWATEAEREHILAKIVKPRNFDILITSYQGAVFCYDILKKITWQMLIVDEAHKMKNDLAIITTTIKEFRANFKLLLTGTPLSNNLRELWSLLNFIMPDIFNTKQIFDSIEQGVKMYDGTDDDRFQYQCSIAKKFHGIIRPFILRRTKLDTDLGLPSKTEHTLFVSMTKLQLEMYKNYLKYRSIWGKGGSRTDNSQMTTRKICNHPYLFPGVQGESSPQYGQHLIQNCGKMMVLDKLLQKIVKKQKQKVLIFSQFKIQMDILQDYMSYRDINYLRLDGDSSVQQREEMMDQFNKDKNFLIPVFMLSTRAGGLGINLVAASVVIIYDIDWNPQNDNQAMDRAYRIGQTKAVRVYKLITEHTIEQRMLQVQKYKLIWDELVIQKGAIMNMKNEDIMTGLNYEKIANMKKGEIFKIQAVKQSKTIDEIIKIGEIKDGDKYKQIKQKILKQIEQQKANENFSANPFDDIEYEDKQGDKNISTYTGDNLLKKKRQQQMNREMLKDQKNRMRKKNVFMSSIDLPEYHLYENVERIKELMFEIELRKVEVEGLEENEGNQGSGRSTMQKIKKIQSQISQFEEQLDNLKQGSFQQWNEEQFERFIQEEKKQFCENQDNLKRLHEVIPTKTIDEIKEYKRIFYSHEMNKLPHMLKVRKNLLKLQSQTKNTYTKGLFHENLQKNNAFYFKKGHQNSLANVLNNMRISSGIIENGDFLESKQFTEDLNMIELSKILGELSFEKQSKSNLVYSKNLLKKFYNKSQYDDVMQNPHSRQHYAEQFNQTKKRIVEQAKRKLFKKSNPEQKTNQQTDVVI